MHFTFKKVETTKDDNLVTICELVYMLFGFFFLSALSYNNELSD